VTKVHAARVRKLTHASTAVDVPSLGAMLQLERSASARHLVLRSGCRELTCSFPCAPDDGRRHGRDEPSWGRDGPGDEKTLEEALDVGPVDVLVGEDQHSRHSGGRPDRRTSCRTPGRVFLTLVISSLSATLPTVASLTLSSFPRRDTPKASRRPTGPPERCSLRVALREETGCTGRVLGTRPVSVVQLRHAHDVALAPSS
jgi:hypothetical protein